MELSIVIPALNEAKTIAPCVRQAQEAIRFHRLEGEVIVSDNRSTDRTREEALAAGARVVDAPVAGYGNACIVGCQSALGAWMILGDADGSYHFDEIGPFLERLADGCDLVIGNRFRGMIEPGAMPRLNRRFGTPALTVLANLLFSAGIGDLNCGMRGMTRPAFDRLRLNASGMEFATEMIIKAARMGLCIGEAPCNLYRDHRDRPPHLRPWRDGWRHLRLILAFRIESWPAGALMDGSRP